MNLQPTGRTWMRETAELDAIRRALHRMAAEHFNAHTSAALMLLSGILTPELLAELRAVLLSSLPAVVFPAALVGEEAAGAYVRKDALRDALTTRPGSPESAARVARAANAYRTAVLDFRCTAEDHPEHANAAAALTRAEAELAEAIEADQPTTGGPAA